eukprot:TRINITY_DN2317_c0_g1_i3.p1 TRINITY_DN2317_c0_g1~~TRINITY_DN2317_c0_g1_i3.p1  ORF type:complete len:564 (-),score=93.39 TRINITY_DN2317_c0_g1_i3:385-1842(-)
MTFSDDGRGSYTASFTPTSTQYRLYIRYDNDVPNSPFKLSVNPSYPNASVSVINGYGLGTVVQGQWAEFVIEVRDSWGNLIAQNLTTIQNSIRVTFDQQPAEYRFQVLPNSTLLVSYPVPTQDRFSVAVTLNGQPLGGSPVSVAALPSVEPSKDLKLAVLIVCIFCLIVAFLCLCGLLYYQEHKIVRASSPNFLIVILCGAAVGIVSVICRTFNLENWVCVVHPWLLGESFVVLCSALFSKSYRISKIFNANDLMPIKITDFELFRVVLFFICLETLLHTLKFFLSTPVVVLRSVVGSSILTYHTCSSEKEPLWNAILFGYKFLFLIYGVYLAFVSRNVPALFNESQVISVVIANVAICTAIALPVAASLEPVTPAPVFAIETYFVLWIVLFTVCVIFLPKLYYSFIDMQIDIFDDDGATNSRNSIALTSEVQTLKKQVADLRRLLSTKDVELSTIRTSALSSHSTHSTLSTQSMPSSPPPPSQV